MPVREIDEPYRTTTTEGVFVRGHATQEAAQASVDQRNAEAAALGIKGRYEVREVS